MAYKLAIKFRTRGRLLLARLPLAVTMVTRDCKAGARTYIANLLRRCELSILRDFIMFKRLYNDPIWDDESTSNCATCDMPSNNSSRRANAPARGGHGAPLAAPSPAPAPAAAPPAAVGVSFSGAGNGSSGGGASRLHAASSLVSLRPCNVCTVLIHAAPREQWGRKVPGRGLQRLRRQSLQQDHQRKGDAPVQFLQRRPPRWGRKVPARGL